MNYLTKSYRNGRGNAGLNIWDEMDRVFDNFFVDSPLSSGRGTYSPVVDVREEEDAYILEAELPGLSEKDVDVKVEDNLLTIQSAKDEKKEDKKDDYLIRERRSSRFSRSFVLPKDVDADSIEGNYKNGILNLRLAKKPEAKPKSIKIKLDK